MSRRASFGLVVELDAKAIEAVNARLRTLGGEGATRAMRNGFRRWTKVAQKAVEAAAPFGRTSSVETVRGAERPNVHLKFAVATKVKGYSKGQVVWAGVGIKEIAGSYLTPHWYLRWVEFGHDIKRRSTDEERRMLLARGESAKLAKFRTIGKVKGSFFLTKTLKVVEPLAVPMLEEAIEREVSRG
jgi:hypothetical protein